MLIEPPLDRAALLTDLRDAYGLTGDSLEFVPVGWASAAFVLRVAGERYFLKLWPGGRDADAAVQRFPFVQRLQSLGFSARVPSALPTRTGELSVSLPPGIVALFPYLPGTTPPGWPAWPEDILQELGRTLAELHSVDPGDTLPFREQFSVAVADEVLLHADDKAAQPYRAELLDQLDRLRSLQQDARRLNPGFVVCHTDLVGDNMLLDSNGRLSLLDWDGAQLAPAEQDLALLLHGAQPVDGTALAKVLPVYPRELRLELFGFFLLRRYLEDFAARLTRLRRGNLSAEETADALDGLARWGSTQWLSLDRTLAVARLALSRRP
ncbi:MAG TPA: aminoglycoside phosphotransferase family protein [Kribbella sp.]